MIECIFTLDYELYGSGSGSLNELVYEPARRLIDLFNRFRKKFVTFVEACEFQQIERHRTDHAIFDVQQQIRQLYKEGFEIGLHLHPQWANAKYEHGEWVLDYAEYNLCTLPRPRIEEIVDNAIAYLQETLGDPGFVPFSFRAGNWLFQPSREAAKVLAERGVQVDSSVYAGGVQRQHELDYRRALQNGFTWRFGDDVNVPDPNGLLLELPIHTEMVPVWRMITSKRASLQKKTVAAVPRRNSRISRMRDFLRFRQPLKFDFCRMTLRELTSMIENMMRKDAISPRTLKPLVAIGHTKDLVDLETVEAFLHWLEAREIGISTFHSSDATR
jgi:hypothetical protein